jgi:glutathione S-transferase
MYQYSRWAPQDRSGKVGWLLNELEAPFETITLNYEKDRQHEFVKLHPLNLVPVLSDSKNNITLFESGAICLYLADQHPEKNLLPNSLRGFCYQWIMYNFSTLEPVITQYWDLNQEDPDLDLKKSMIDKKISELLNPIERQLSKGAFICGDQFTVADIPITQSIFWLRNRPILNNYPLIADYLNRMQKRGAAIKSELFQD